MQKSLKISFIAHSVILIISSVTLPFLMGRVQAPLVMSVDLVQIGERTNIPYAPKVSDGAKTDKKIKEKKYMGRYEIEIGSNFPDKTVKKFLKKSAIRFRLLKNS